LQKIFDKALVVGYDLQQSGVLLKAQQNLTISNPYCLKVALNYLSRATGKSFKYMEKDFLGKLPRAVYSDWKTPRTTISDRESLVACCKYQEQLFRDIVKRFRENSLISRGDTLVGQLELGDSYFELEMSLLPALVEASSAGIKVAREELERLLVQQTALDSTEGRSTLVGILQSCEASKPMLHAYFKQIASITGRLSSVNPNIMGIDREFHRFVLSRSGHVLLSADYSQIEPRIAASYAGEEALLQVFREGKDIYIEIASSLFQIAPDSVDTETRSKIKTMFLGLLYGMGAKALQKRLLDRGIDVTISEAKELIINFKNAYPKLGGLIDESGKLAAEQKKAGGMITVRTMIGRPITIDSAVAEESELRAHNFNHIIQGTGADILKLAAVEFHKRIREEGLRAQIVNLVHDEILVEVFREDRDRVREVLVNVMEMVGREVIGVDTPVECGVGSNWRIAKEKQL
jgi:DNA polymerase I-like protein with 3'-5' exonuclease and polymerase domains